MKTVLVSAVALINAQKHILVAKRPAGKNMAGLWEFPGGKLEPGELPDAALIREIQEEIGISITAESLNAVHFVAHTYADFNLILFFYTCFHWRGEAQPKEGQQLLWCTQELLESLDMPPADVPLLAVLDKIIKSC